METIVVTQSYTHNNGKPDQQSGCAWELTHYDDHERKGYRVISQPVGNCTQPQAQLNAARMGLASITKMFRRTSVLLLVPKYVHDILASDKEPKKNKDEINELRRWAGYFTDLKVEVAPKADGATHLQALAKECALNQAQSDTGTNVEDQNRLALAEAAGE